MNTGVKMEGGSCLKTDGDVDSLLPTVVNWVVIFVLLVKKIGCDDKEMWDAYLQYL